MNQSLLLKLAKIKFLSNKQWDELLDTALWCVRISPIKRIGLSPFQLLFGRNPNSIEIKENCEYANSNKLIKDFNEHLRIIDNMQRTSFIKTNKDKNAKKEFKKTERNFKENDLVLKRNFARTNKGSKKLNPKWEGPYQIISDKGKGVYEIKCVNGLIQKMNGRNLKRYTEDVDSEDVESTFNKGGVLGLNNYK